MIIVSVFSVIVVTLSHPARFLSHLLLPIFNGTKTLAVLASFLLLPLFNEQNPFRPFVFPYSPLPSSPSYRPNPIRVSARCGCCSRLCSPSSCNCSSSPIPRLHLPSREQAISSLLAREMTSVLWRMYADRVYSRWEKTFLWDMIEAYRRPKSFTPLVSIYIAAFYSGVVGSAITEQLHKEKYWEDHPGEAVPLMQPKFYYGPWKILRGEALSPNQ